MHQPIIHKVSLFQMKHTTLLLVVITSCCVSLISSSKILALSPYIGKSHFDVFEPFVKELAARGHQVLVLTHFPQKYPVANYTDVSLVGSITIERVTLNENIPHTFNLI